MSGLASENARSRGLENATRKIRDEDRTRDTVRTEPVRGSGFAPMSWSSRWQFNGYKTPGWSRQRLPQEKTCGRRYSLQPTGLLARPRVPPLMCSRFTRPPEERAFNGERRAAAGRTSDPAHPADHPELPTLTIATRVVFLFSDRTCFPIESVAIKKCFTNVGVVMLQCNVRV